MIEILSAKIALIAGVLSLIGLVWGPKAWPSLYSWFGKIWDSISYPFRKGERDITELRALHKQLSENVLNIATKLDEVAKQFVPNGGSSIKDSLNRIELTQAASENVTSFLLNNMGAAIYKTDSSGKCTWASKSYCDISARPLEDILGWGWLNSVDQRDVDYVRNAWKAAVEEKRIFEAKFHVVHPKGTIIKVYSRAVPTHFNNEIAGWVGSWEIIDGG